MRGKWVPDVCKTRKTKNTRHERAKDSDISRVWKYLDNYHIYQAIPANVQYARAPSKMH